MECVVKKSERKFSICFIILAAVMSFNMYTTYQREKEIVNNINVIGKLLTYYKKYIPDYIASRQASVIRSEIFKGSWVILC
jgi:hypothetical protein